MSEPEVFRKKCAVLKVLVTLLGLFGTPVVIRRPRNCALLATPLRMSGDRINCADASIDLKIF